jgi:dynein heavy chain
MPITDRTSKALLNFSGSQDGQLTPTFPSFLPLEIFDNTEFDCRTPEEWLELGEHGNTRRVYS